MRSFVSLICWAVLAFALKAQAADPCTNYNITNDDVGAQRQQVTSGCFLSIHPYDLVMVYRDYLLTSDGEFMVFNSYGEAEGPTMTGARVFYFFPRTQTPDIQATATQVLVKTANPAVTLQIDRKTFAMKGVTNGKVTEDKNVLRTNAGGIELSKMSVLWLDSGFHLGSDPTADETALSTFHDSKNQTCTVKNAELFNYSSSGDVAFKFDDTELSKFLKSRCGNMTVEF